MKPVFVLIYSIWFLLPPESIASEFPKKKLLGGMNPALFLFNWGNSPRCSGGREGGVEFRWQPSMIIVSLTSSTKVDKLLTVLRTLKRQREENVNLSEKLLPVSIKYKCITGTKQQRNDRKFNRLAGRPRTEKRKLQVYNNSKNLNHQKQKKKNKTENRKITSRLSRDSGSIFCRPTPTQ